MFLYPKRHSGSPLVVGLLILSLTTKDVHAKWFSASRSRSSSSIGKSSPSHHSAPAPHTNNVRVSYGGGYQSKSSKVSSSQTHSAVPSAPAKPISWHVPASTQGPYKPSLPSFHAATQKPVGVASPSSSSRFVGVHSSIGHRNPNNYTGGYGSSKNVHSIYPAGATYHSNGQIPVGAIYHKTANFSKETLTHQHHHHHHRHHGTTFHPNATFLPAGGALPAGAVFYPQRPNKFGLEIDTELIADVGQAFVRHVKNNPNGGIGHNENIIIINNGPPGSVATGEAESDTTVINSGGRQGFGSSSLPVQPLNTSAPETPFDKKESNRGDIICVPVIVLHPDPKDPTKTIEVDQIACYPAPPMENGQKRSDGLQHFILTSIVVTLIVAY